MFSQRFSRGSSRPGTPESAAPTRDRYLLIIDARSCLWFLVWRRFTQRSAPWSFPVSPNQEWCVWPRIIHNSPWKTQTLSVQKGGLAQKKKKKERKKRGSLIKSGEIRRLRCPRGSIPVVLFSRAHFFAQKQTNSRGLNCVAWLLPSPSEILMPNSQVDEKSV